MLTPFGIKQIRHKTEHMRRMRTKTHKRMIPVRQTIHDRSQMNIQEIYNWARLGDFTIAFVQDNYN